MCDLAPYIERKNRADLPSETHSALRSFADRSPTANYDISTAGDRYLDQNFLHGRRFADLDDLNAQGLHWCRHTANVRIHATTQRRPDELLLAVELPKLAPIAQLRPYAPALARKVDAESLVSYRGSRYSVPPAHVGQLVSVTALGGKITIKTGDLIVAEHAPVPPGRSQIAPEHLQALWKQTVARATAERHAPPPRCTVTFAQPVEQRPLNVYAEVTG